MRLQISSFNDNGPSAYLKWFLSETEIEKAKEMTEPVILISVANSYLDREYYTEIQEEARVACPLEQGGCFVSFRNPGRAHIYADIFEGNDSCWGKYSVKEFLTIDEKNSGYNTYSVSAELQYEGSRIGSKKEDYLDKIEKSEMVISGRRSVIVLKKYLTVDVDSNLFAKKPRDWNLVNCWFDKPAENEYQLWQRRFVAYPYTLVFFLIAYPLDLMMHLFLVLLGYYNYFNWQYLTHPLTAESSMSRDNEKRPYHIFKDKSWQKIVFSWRIILLISIVGSIPFIVYRATTHIEFSVLNLMCQFCFIGFLLFITAFAPLINKDVREKYQKWSDLCNTTFADWRMAKYVALAEQEQKKAEARKLALTKLKDLESINDNAIENLLSPEEKNMIRLHWNRLKRRGYKPFPGK